MKSKALSLMALAVAVAPLTAPVVAQGEPLSVRACANAYIAENFPGRESSIRIEEVPVASYAPRLPLIVYSERKVKLTATEVNTGRVLGNATCSTKTGTVTVTPIS
jgi:hypothetical protein